jgi:hypothetical protein
MEGINVSLILSSASLISILGIGAKLWIANRGQRVGPQPFVVAAAERSTPQGQCDERHREIDSRTSNLFSRMSAAEQRIAAVEASHQAQIARLESMDGKLDRLLSRKG